MRKLGARHTLLVAGVIVAATLVSWAATVRAVDAEQMLPPHVPGEILLQWDTGGVPQRLFGQQELERQQLMTALDARLAGQVEALGIERWRVPPSRLSDSLARLQASPAIKWAEPNYLIQLIDAVPQRSGASSARLALDVLPRVLGAGVGDLAGLLHPNDPYYTSYAARYLQRLQAEEAWSQTLGDPAVVVAIVDTGVDCQHEDLQGGCWVNQDEIPNNGLDDDHNGYVDDRYGWNFPDDSNDPTDVHFHGTHVAGIVGARINNGLGIAGMAGRTTLMPLAVFQPQGVGTYYDLIRAVLYAVDNGARIINMSLGATTYSRGEALAMKYAWDHGVLPIAAAGNNNSDRVFYPAAHPWVMSVAATDDGDIPASFTNYGTDISVAAPGVSIISTVPGNAYGALSGTSMATPHVAGLAALILARNPALTPAEVRATIQKQADDQVGPPDQDTPGWDIHYGYGRINAARALAATSPGSGAPPSEPPEAPLLPWTPPCQDLIDGGFEGDIAPWHLENGAQVTTSLAFEGTHAVYLPAASDARLWQRVALPANALRATFFMALRIDTADSGQGPRPDFPFDDWLTVTWRDGDDQVRTTLLNAGNTSDNVAHGLTWDEVLAILPAEDLVALRGRTLSLDIRTGDDGDAALTTFAVDAVRFCVVEARYRVVLPLVKTPDG